jgi:hypothetical protein
MSVQPVKITITKQLITMINQCQEKIDNVKFGEIHFFVRNGEVYRAEVRESIMTGGQSVSDVQPKS